MQQKPKNDNQDPICSANAHSTVLGAKYKDKNIKLPICFAKDFLVI